MPEPTEPTSRPVRVGVFTTVTSADQAVDGLTAAGFTSEEISVICSDEHKERHFKEFLDQDQAGTDAPRNIAVGGTIGATLGALTAIAGAAATGGVALLVAGGAAAWAGGVAGGFVGAMMSRGVEREAADFYDQAVQQGKILVAIEDHGPNQAARLVKAEQLLAAAGAEPLPLREG